MASNAGGRLTVRTGLFLPDLECGLQEILESRLTSIRQSRRLRPCAIVSLSEEIRRYLKHRITLRWRMKLAGVHLLTADSLSLRIVATAPTGQISRRVDALVLADLVRDVILNESFPAEWKELVQSAGGAAALLKTLRDLEEARIPSEAGQREPVLRLHRLYQTARKRLGLGTPTDSVEEAIRVAHESRFLQSLEEIVYYGFYDLTQIQMDLLTKVSTLRPVSVLFPCVADHRAYDFANGFLEELRVRFENIEVRPAADPGIHGRAEGGGSTPLRSAMGRLFSETQVDGSFGIAGDSLRFFTVSGPEAELEVAAKEILRWTEEGIDFNEMGIIARDLRPYLTFLPSVLTAHAIPFRTPEKLPVSRLPWAKALRTLHRILAEGFPKMDVLEWTRSPYSAFREEESTWDHSVRSALRRSGAIRGLNDWKKIAQASPVELAGSLHTGAEGQDPEPEDVGAFRRFQMSLQRLIEAVGRFPARCEWGGFVDAYRMLLREVMIFPVMKSEEATDLRTVDVESGWRLIEDILESVGIRKGTGQEAEAADFLSAVDEQVSAHEVLYWDFTHPGIEVLNARDARAKQFAAVIVMGLQEGVWPRRENADPFLGEGMRERLSKRFSARLRKGSEGVEEERLLFTLALTSAERYATLTCQRSGEDGQPLVRSWYVHEVARALGREDGSLPSETHVPRRLDARIGNRLFTEHLWTPPEWSAHLAANQQDPSKLWRIRGIPLELLNRSFDAGLRLDRLGKTLTDRDGMTGGLPDLWESLRGEGFAPTALEQYARCPFRFFAEYALDLEELTDPEESPELEAVEMGRLLHRIFQRFFKAWSSGRPDDEQELLRKVIESTLKAYEEQVPVGYPLLWSRTQEEIRSIAELYILEGLGSLAESGYRPVAYETSLETALRDVPQFPSFLRGVKIRGRLDRIDRREGEAGIEIRVVDYKYRSGSKPSGGKLEQDALQGSRLQPPFYVLLAEAQERGAKASAEFHYLAPNWSDPAGHRDAFPAGQWQSPWAEEMVKSLAAILRGIHDGHFYIIPKDGEYSHCATCSYQVLCRRNHRSTRYRQKADPRTLAIEDLSEKRWPPKK